MQAFEVWTQDRRTEREELAGRTDKALQDLKQNFTFLEPSYAADTPGPAQSEPDSNANWLLVAGRALDRELAWWSKDALQGMPSKLVLRQGQRLFERLQEEQRVLQAVSEVVGDLTKEWELHQEALDSTGSSCREMQRAMDSVKDTTEGVLDAREELDAAEKKLATATRKMASDAELSHLTQDKTEMSRLFKEALRALQEDLRVLLMHEREYPEVMATVNKAMATLMEGKGVSLSLSRPVMEVLDLSVSLAVFDELEVLSTLSASRHVVYKAREGQS